MEAAEPRPSIVISNGPKLRRELTLLDALSIVVGIIVGSGIFTTPGIVLAQAGSVGESLLVWLVAGGISLCLALLYAELGTSIPVASGDAEFYKTAFGPSWSFAFNWTCFLVLYFGTVGPNSLVVYCLQTAFGPSWSFAFIWTCFLVLYSGSITIFAISLSQYVLAAITNAEAQDVQGDGRILYIAVSSVVLFTICNCVGVRWGSFLQNFLGLCKTFLVLVVLVVAAIFLKRDTTVLQANVSKPFMGSSFSGFGPSMVAALWAFCGVSNIVFITEELKNPTRDIPRASIGGILIVTGTYLAVNLSYLSVLPSSDIKKTFTIAMDTTKVVFGQQAGRFTAILVALALLGSLNATILCGGRYLFCAARDGHFNGGWVGQVNERNGAPIAALTAQGVWCAVLLLVSTDLVKFLNYFSISQFFFSGLIAIAHWKLRYQFPELPRPFMVPFHPCLNIVVLGSSMYMIAASIWVDPLPTSVSLILVFLSFPVYYVFVKKKNLETLPDNENFALLS